MNVCGVLAKGKSFMTAAVKDAVVSGNGNQIQNPPYSLGALVETNGIMKEDGKTG